MTAEIRQYTVRDLKQAIDEDILWQGDVYCISKERAISFVNNPRADEGDVILAVAYENNRVVGYGGALPDKMFIDGKECKFAWGTSWWAEFSQWRTNLSTRLTQIWFEQYDGNVGIRQFSRAAENAIKRAKMLFSFKTELGSCFSLTRRTEWQDEHKTLNHVKLEYLTQIDRETKEFIECYRHNEFTKRGASELNWILKYPWCLQAPLDEITRAKYYFSLVSNQFFNLCIKVLDEKNRMIGCMILLIRDKTLSVPYIYYKPDGARPMQTVICFHLARLDVEIFKTYNCELIHYFKDIKFPYSCEEEISRQTLISRKFEGIKISSDFLQDGDGDCAFWA